MKRIKAFILLLCCILFSVETLSSQTETVTLLGDSLQEVVVTARRAREIIPGQSLSGRQLQHLSSNSVADALRYFSGVQIKDYGGIGGLKTINIRSMGSQHVGVFYDGIQITNAQNGTVDLGKFSMDNMEVLSVYNGQKSDVFQSAKDFASAGAFYMVSRRPVFKDSDNNFNFKLKSGSFDLVDFSGLWEHRWGKNIVSSVNAEVLNTSGKYKFRYQKEGGYDTTEVRRNGDVFFIRTEAAVFGKNNSSDWMLKGYFYTSERGYPGAAVKKDYEISLLNEDRQKDRNFFVQGSFTKRVSDFYQFMLKAKYANDYMNYVMPPETTVQPANNHYWQQEVYASFSNLFNLTEGWTANVAADFQWNKLNADGSDMFNANFIQPRRYTFLVAAATSLDLSFGLKMQGSVLYTYLHDKGNGKSEPAPDKNEFTPTLLFSYKPFRMIDLNFRAFYKNIFRMPTFNDLYYVQLGSRSLKPEYTDQFDIGLSFRKRFAHSFCTEIRVSADAYYNTVKDKIIATPTSNQLTWTMVNLGYVKIRGVDMGVTPTFRLADVDLSVRLSYTWQKAQDYTEEKKEPDLGEGVISVYGDQIPYIPVHSGSAIINCSYRSWNLNYSYIYTGERYMLGGNIPVNYVPAWYTHDVSLSKSIRVKKCLLDVTAEINNLFNQQYEVVKWYPMPGTNFKVILSLTL